MKHMATGQLIAMIGEAQRELAQRFNVAGAQPQVRPQRQRVCIKTLLDDGSGREFYSVCGNVADCGCRYNIVPKTPWAEGDREKRPPIDECVLYLHGLGGGGGHPKDGQAHLEGMLASAHCRAVEIKVIRNRYAFLTFATHAEATAAQRVLSVFSHYSVSFNRINSDNKYRQQQPRRKDSTSSGGEDHDSVE